MMQKHLSRILPFAQVLGPALLFFTALWGKAGLFSILVLLAMAMAAEFLWNFRRHAAGSPYAFMLLSPLLLLHYSSVWDFRIRLFSFFLVAVIVAVALCRPAPRFRLSVQKWTAAGHLTLVIAIFFIFAFLLYNRGIYLSGDEPHYLLIAQSLVEDGDIDLKNNMEAKSYLSFHPVDLEFHGSVHKSRWVPFHLPGLSLLLMPFYWLYTRLLTFIPPQLFFRLVAGLINAFFAAGLLRLLQKKFPAGNVSAIWLLLVCTFPLLFHSLHLYPELPAGALLLFAFMLGIEEQKKYLLAGLLLGIIPWFHAKYALPCSILVLFIIWRLIRGKKWKNAALLMLPLALGWLALMIYARIFYESFNPNAIFLGGDYFSVSHLARAETFLAFFLDQRDGLLVYAPYTLFLFFGFRGKMANRAPLLLMFFSYLLFHAFTTVRGAYSPAGRPVMFVWWIAALLLANYRFEKEEAGKIPFRLAAGLSFFSLIWLCYHPLFMYQPVTGGSTERASALLAFLGSTSFNLSPLFPSFLKVSNAAYPANHLWLAALLLMLLLFYLKRSLFIERIPRPIGWLLLGAFGFLLCFWPHVHISYQRRFIAKDIAFFNNSRNFSFIQEKGIFRIKSGDNYDIFLDRQLTEKPGLTLTFTNCRQAGVTLWSGRNILFHSSPQDTNTFSFALAGLHRLEIQNFRVAHLGFQTRALVPGAYLFLKIE